MIWALVAIIGWVIASYGSMRLGKLVFSHDEQPSMFILLAPLGWATFGLALHTLTGTLSFPILIYSSVTPGMVAGYWVGQGKLRQPITVSPIRLFVAARPVMGLFASLLIVAAFRLQGITVEQYGYQKMSVLISLVVGGLTIAMVWNDWYDRDHDAKKGKTYARDNEDLYFRYSFTLGIVVAGLISLIDFRSWQFWFSMLLMIGSLYYVRTYQIPLLPAITVALVSALPSLYWIGDNRAERPFLGFIFCVLIFVYIIARETLKDLADVEVDVGYKMTPPIVWGERAARLFAAGLLMIVALSLEFLGLAGWLHLTPLLALAAAAITLKNWNPPTWGKLCVDLGCVLLLTQIIAGTVPN